MNKKHFSRVRIGLAAILAAAVGCSSETVLEDLAGVHAEGPVFLGARAVSATRVEFSFNKEVAVQALRLDSGVAAETLEHGAVAAAILSQALPEGQRLIADLLVEDAQGNTLTVLTPFTARNDRMPRLRITEVRTEYSKPKVELVEFRTETAGQVGALRLVSSERGLEDPLFTFPPAELAAGEYVVLHLRTLDPASLDETGTDLSLSVGTEAGPARDFWRPGAEKLVRKTDALALLDQDGRALDAVLLSETADAAWTKDTLSRAATVFEEGLFWKKKTGETGPLLPADAADSRGTTATRTICRDEAVADSDTRADWYVTVTGGATPGAPNSTDRYVP
jgi:hypothetical protein